MRGQQLLDAFAMLFMGPKGSEGWLRAGGERASKSRRRGRGRSGGGFRGRASQGRTQNQRAMPKISPAGSGQQAKAEIPGQAVLELGIAAGSERADDEDWLLVHGVVQMSRRDRLRCRRIEFCRTGSGSACDPGSCARQCRAIGEFFVSSWIFWAKCCAAGGTARLRYVIVPLKRRA